MTTPITVANIVEVFKITPTDLLAFESLLQSGDLYGFETALRTLVNNFYTNICDFFIRYISVNELFIARLKTLASSLGLKKMSKRSTTLRLGNGERINYMDYYAEEVPLGYDGERFLSHLYFQNIHKSSLFHSLTVSELSVLTPSFMIGQQVLSDVGIRSNAERNRQLSLELGNIGLSDRVENMVAVEENVAGKRVIIGIDGGRTRTRAWKETETKDAQEKEYGTFGTPWVEPKLLVISILDEEGKVKKKELPIYDACFGDDELIALLSAYLTQLHIEQATCVQVVADGAVWIWNRVRPMLEALGVEASKIIETVDYYHAVEHLAPLKALLPQEKQAQTIKDIKEKLWQGDVKAMKTILLENMTQPDKEQIIDLQYFEKNENRIQYQKLKDQKLPIGSGIVESGIRRIINLRFKCPSAFWNKENLQPLFYLRAVFLAGRRTIFIDNLKRKKKVLQI